MKEITLWAVEDGEQLKVKILPNGQVEFWIMGRMGNRRLTLEGFRISHVIEFLEDNEG